MNLTQVEELAKLAAQAELGRLAPARRFVAEVSEEQGRGARKPKEAPKKAEGRIPVAPTAVVSPLGVEAGRAVMAAPERVAAPLAPPIPLGETTTFSLRSMDLRAELPFQRPTPAPAPLVETAPALPAEARKPALPFAGPALEASPGVITAPTLEVPRGPALPFRPRPVEANAALSLSQYAALCAELALSPAGAEAIFRRYGLEAQERRAAVDAAWKERLRRDPAEYQAWYDLYQRWHAHLAAGGAPPG